MTGFLQKTGGKALDIVQEMGQMSLFLFAAVRSIFVPPFRGGLILKQIHFIGVRSIFIIALTAIFTGMVLALQGYYTLARFGSEGLLGSAVALTIIREIGPVLSGLMVTARAGSALTAEIGIMRIREQIDALEAMGVSSLNMLVGPRLLAGLIVLPLLTGLFDCIGILGGYLVGVQLLNLSSGVYFAEMSAAVKMNDITMGFIKSISFGILVTWICTFKGYYTERGAEGVSKATTSAVVLASVVVLVCDYFITSVMM